jgi:dolichol-phosphate mannosyltransferase
MAATLGLVMAFVSFAMALGLIARNLIWGASVVGWTSLIVAVFIVGGIQIFVTGIVGIYVGKCFEEAKRRPLYFVRETINMDEPAQLPRDAAAGAVAPPWERARA